MVALEGKREIATMMVGDALSAVSASDWDTADCESKLRLHRASRFQGEKQRIPRTMDPVNTRGNRA